MSQPSSAAISKSADPGPNHFIFGAEPYLVEAAKNKLIKIIRERENEELPLDKLDLEERPLDELLTVCRTLPLFARRQIVQVKGAIKLKEGQAKRLAEYLLNPSPSTFLVFTAGALDKEDRKKRVFEILVHNTKVVEVFPWSEAEVRIRVEARFRNSGFQIAEDALDFFVETQGTDLGRISTEVEKLILLVGDNKKITLENVVASLGYSREHTVFEFIDALAAKDKVMSLRFANEMMSDSAQALQTLFLMHRLFRQFLQMKEFSARMSSGEIARQIGMYGVPVAVIERKAQQSKHFSYLALVRAIEQLGLLDDRIKRSSIDTKVFMEQLIHGLTN
jgi:DNA polymerase-3 subunit delta